MAKVTPKEWNKMLIYPNGKIDWNYSIGGAFEKSVFAALADCFDPLGNVLPL